MDIVIATNNQGKLREFKEMLKGIANVKSLQDIGFNEEIIEDGNTFLENALIKAKAVSKFSNAITISDDSGLVVEALDGRPGIYSARYAGNDLLNNQKVLNEMEGIKNRNAFFEVSLVIYYPNGEYRHYEARMYGEIGYKIVDKNGFGYDKIFYLPEYQKYNSELEPEEKNKISHRGQALRKLVDDLK